MRYACTVRRSVLLALTLLSACAASEPNPQTGSDRAPSGVIGNFLTGRFALAEGDNVTAANDLLKALAQSPGNPDLTVDAFIACLNAGRPEVVKLARQLPDNQMAQLVLADNDIKTGHWQAAEQRFHGMGRQGVTQLLQPLLVAWAQQGDGRTEAALATLRPYVDSRPFRVVFAIHAAMIADLGNRRDDAAQLYRIAQSEQPESNLRMTQILSSWTARSGRPAEAQHLLSALPANVPELAIALPGLAANVVKRPVANAADGVAEAYFTFAALLRIQNANELSLLMLRLALDIRPDFAPARMVAADILANGRHLNDALRMLAEVPSTEALYPVVRLRRVAFTDRLGRSDEALQELDKMSREYPNSPLPEEGRGDILRAKQRFAEAIVAYDNAVARLGEPAPSDWVVFYDRGVAEERTHQWPKAKADFEMALKLSPDQPFVLNYLGYSYADMGHNLDEARSMLERAAARRPNDGAITDSLGWVLMRQGHADQAVKVLERAVELDSEDATINGHLGDAYDAVGRKIEAVFQWRRALTLNPEPEDRAKLQAKVTSARGGAVASGK